MADRYSSPTPSTATANRFRVWPAGSDSYDHAELAGNWDKLDAIIGAPSDGSAWPPTPWGADGGLYKITTLLSKNDTPVGTVSYWFRPSVAVPLTVIYNAGWAVCDGLTLTASQHSFPGIATSVTLPNLINKFVLGADFGKTIGESGVAVSNANIDATAGAPGPQGTGGTNQSTLSISQIPAHDHGGGNHTHLFRRQVIQLDAANAERYNYLFDVRDAYTHETATQPSGNIISSQGSGAAHENRPAYIGLIPIIKVKIMDTV